MPLELQLKKIGDKVGLDLNFLIKNSFWTILRQLITLITGLALSVVMVRLLTQDIFGNFQIYLSILAIVAIFSLPGLNTSMIRSVAKGFDGSYEKAVKVSFIWSLLGIPTLFILGIFYFLNGNQPLGIGLMVSGLIFPFMYAFNSWDVFLQGKERFDLAMKYSSIQAVVYTAILSVAIYIRPNNLLLIIVVNLFVGALFNIYWYIKSRRYVRSNEIDQDVVPYGKFLTKVNILTIISTNIDKLLVGIFIGPGELAIYAVGINFCKRIFDFIKSILAIYTAKITRTNTATLRKYALIFLIFLVVTIIVVLLIPVVLNFLYTQKYNSSVPLAQMVIIFLPFYVINIFYKNHFLFYTQNKKVILVSSIVVPIIKIVLMIPLVIFWGIFGLALLYGTQFVLDLVVLFVLEKKFKST
ncbi:MAG: polysaccharide biosynthesis protein [uncultured bacterium]|nr:MAG: polysaccharide biosynthesis protein [uncultured bacterium]